MNRLGQHVRSTFLAGAFALVPIVVTVVAVAYVDGLTRVLSERATGRSVPLLGILIAVVGVYAVGLAARSIVGRFAVGLVDRLLTRVPLLGELYRAWKQIGYAPGGGEGMYATVVLVPCDGGGRGTPGDDSSGDSGGDSGGDPLLQIGFTSGLPAGGLGEAERVCVFVPNVPNPVVGRLLFVERRRVRVLAMSIDEAFKLLISSGNYLPPGLDGRAGEGAIEVAVPEGATGSIDPGAVGGRTG